MELTATKMAPPFKLVAHYLIAAVCSFVVLSVLFAFSWNEIHGHHFQPRLLALTHIATLGWITMAIFGALFQLVPVVLEVPLWSARLGLWQFWIFTIGTICLVTGFWTFSVGMHLDLAPLLLIVAGYMFVFNMLRTIQRVKQGNLTAYFLVAGLFYFFLTITLGALLAVNLGHPFLTRNHLDFLKLHAILGLIGWVLMIVMGVALKLVPMFSMSHDYSLRPAWYAFALVNLGILGATTSALFWTSDTAFIVCCVAIALGLASYAIQLSIILKHRLRKALDVAMQHVLVSVACLLLGIVAGLVLLFADLAADLDQRVVLFYGFIALFGVVSALIIGQMYKIVPFLVWLQKYAPLAGTKPVPAMKDMIDQRLARYELWSIVAALVLVGIGMLSGTASVLGVGALLIVLAAALFAYNIFLVFVR